MLSIFLDGLGEQLLNSTNAAIAHLQELRGQNILYRLLLLLPLYVVKIVKGLIVSPLVVGGSGLANYWYPRYCREFKEMLIHSIPNNLRCYNKTGLLVIFIDFYCTTVCINRLFVNRFVITYTYLVLKILTFVTPFMMIAPLDRFPFWILGAALILLEIPSAIFVVQCVGRGIDWNTGQSFYHNWGPHYRYRRMTTNRKLTLELSCYVYPAFKLTLLTSFLCYNETVADRRLLLPHLPSKAGLVSPKVHPLPDMLDYCEEASFCPGFGMPPLEFQEYSTPAVSAVKTFFGLQNPDGSSVTLPGASVAPLYDSVTADLLSPDLDYITALTEPDTVVNMRYGVLFLLALSSLSVYSIILAGWASNSKYAFIGALRSAAQMISYEVAISLILLPVVLLAGSLNLTMITYVQSITVWFLFPLLPASVLFLIAMLAETNRTPFDLPEAEAELVAGYNVDYSSLPFAMFFLGEYCNMILISTLYCLLFLGGGLNSVGLNTALVLSLKAAIIWVFFVNVRATLPRYRYDQLMDIGWKVFLPIAGGFLVFIFGLLIFLDALPYTTELPLNAWKVVEGRPSIETYVIWRYTPEAAFVLCCSAPRFTSVSWTVATSRQAAADSWFLRLLAKIGIEPGGCAEAAAKQKALNGELVLAQGRYKVATDFRLDLRIGCSDLEFLRSAFVLATALGVLFGLMYWWNVRSGRGPLLAFNPLTSLLTFFGADVGLGKVPEETLQALSTNLANTLQACEEIELQNKITYEFYQELYVDTCLWGFAAVFVAIFDLVMLYRNGDLQRLYLRLQKRISKTRQSH